MQISQASFAEFPFPVYARPCSAATRAEPSLYSIKISLPSIPGVLWLGATAVTPAATNNHLSYVK